VFSYDAAGRLESRTDFVDGKAFNVLFHYDDNDNLLDVTYPSGRKIAYTYDSENRVASVYNAYSPTLVYAGGFGYSAAGALEAYQTSNGITNAYSHDPADNRVTAITAGPLQLTYHYDPVGNVTLLQDSRAGYDQTFTYDALDRLQTVSSQAYPSAVFAYDPHGNRVSVGNTTYTCYPGTFRMQSANGLQMTYDANGNLKTGPQATFDYTPSNMLRSSTVAGVTATYGYDADGWRVKKGITGGVTAYYMRGPDGQLLSEFDAITPTPQEKDYMYAGSQLIGVFTAPLPQ
jgi:YD repeat-containing protein